MKKTLAVLIASFMLLFGLAISASAKPTTGVLMKIPFAFYAGDQLMPSGSYVFEMPSFGSSAIGSLVRVTKADGTLCMNVISQVVGGVMTDNDFHVTFTRYGDLYFLSKVRNTDFGAALPTSRSEKKLAGEYRRSLGTVNTVELVQAPSKAR